MKKYERPEIKFADVRLNEGIAGTCWGLKPGHTKDYEYFYDVEGTGYVGFHIKSVDGSCGAPDAYNIKYYEYEGATGVDGTKYEAEVEIALTKGGGNNGQNYGNLMSDFPTKPDESWS